MLNLSMSGESRYPLPMFSITPESPTRTHIRFGSLESQQSLIARVSELQDELRRLCDAVAILEPRNPRRVRRQVVEQQADCEVIVRQVEEEADGYIGELSGDVRDMLYAQECLNNQVERTLDALDVMEDPGDLFEPRSQRRPRRDYEPPRPRLFPQPRML